MSQPHPYLQSLQDPVRMPAPPPRNLPGTPPAQQPAAPQWVQDPGGSLYQLLLAQRYTPWAQEGRKIGDASMYDPALSPSQPFQFPLTTVQVPNSMGIFVTGYEIRIFTFSGVAASDTVEVDPGNLSTSLGIEFQVGQASVMDVTTEITPVRSGLQAVPPALLGPRQTFYNARAGATGGASGAGRALLPFDQRPVLGEKGPWSVYLTPQSGGLTVSMYVFEPLEFPVAFFQVKLSGYKINQETGAKILQQLNPLGASCPRFVQLPLDATWTQHPRGAFPPLARCGREGDESRARPSGDTMTYRNAAIALQGVTDLTTDWGTFGNLIQTRPDPGTEGFCYEFTLVRRSAVNVSTAVALAEAVAMGAAVAGYSWDVYGVLLSTGAAGFPVVQVVFQFSDWTIAGDLGAINAAVNEAVFKSGLGDGIGAVSMLRLTAPESRYFSQQGGLAPLVVTEGKKVSLTKAAVSPSGKQVMSGDVRDLNAATPLSVLKQTVAAATAEAPWGLLLGFGLLGVGVLFLSGYLSPGMRPNGRTVRAKKWHVRAQKGADRFSRGFRSKRELDAFVKAAKAKGAKVYTRKNRHRLSTHPYTVEVAPRRGTAAAIRRVADNLRIASFDRADEKYRRNGSDDAQFALRLLKAKEKPGLLDTARYERGLQELMDAFAYYDQVTESTYQDEPYGEIDDERYKLGDEYGRYLDKKWADEKAAMHPPSPSTWADW